MVEIDVELVEGDVGGGDEDFLDEGIDPLEHCEVERLRAMLVQVRQQLPVLRHSDTKTLTLTLDREMRRRINSSTARGGRGGRGRREREKETERERRRDL